MQTDKNLSVSLADRFVLVLAVVMAIFLIPSAYYNKTFTPDDWGFWVLMGFFVVGLGLVGWKLYAYLTKRKEA